MYDLSNEKLTWDSASQSHKNNKGTGRCKGDLVGVLEVRRGRGDTVRAGGYIIFYGKENKNHQLEFGFLVQHKIVSAGNRVAFFLFC